MSSVAKSVYYFSFYLLLAGAGLFFFPNHILPLLGIPETAEVWVRLVGALTVNLGVFFFYMARQNVRSFFFISLFGRGIFTLSILSVVLFFDAPLPFLLFAGIDIVGFLWTFVTYREKPL